jgi:ETFB lysine methyltransferase
VTSTDPETLAAQLRRRVRTVETAFAVGPREIVLLHPANSDDLISEADFVKDDRLPYWADVWPSSRILAARVLAEDGHGRSFLELGCGSGLVTAAALLAGFTVTASDYYEDAMAFTRVNGFRNAGREPATRLLDWRDMPDELPRYDVVAASDVLYEMTYAPLIASAIARALAPGGVAFLADPGRIGRDEFLREVSAQGLRVLSAEPVPFIEGEIRQTITVFRLAASG